MRVCERGCVKFEVFLKIGVTEIALQIERQYLEERRMLRLRRWMVPGVWSCWTPDIPRRRRRLPHRSLSRT